MRYPRSSAATSAIGPATATATAYRPSLLSGGITSDRVFWLRGLSQSYAAATDASTGNIEFFDSASGVTATAAPVLRIEGSSVSALPIAITAVLTTTGIVTVTTTLGDILAGRAVHNFGAPGIKFSTGITAMLEGSGAIPAGHLTVWGYEE